MATLDIGKNLAHLLIAILVVALCGLVTHYAHAAGFLQDALTGLAFLIAFVIIMVIM